MLRQVLHNFHRSSALTASKVRPVHSPNRARAHPRNIRLADRASRRGSRPFRGRAAAGSKSAAICSFGEPVGNRSDLGTTERRHADARGAPGEHAAPQHMLAMPQQMKNRHRRKSFVAESPSFCRKRCGFRVNAGRRGLPVRPVIAGISHCGRMRVALFFRYAGPAQTREIGGFGQGTDLGIVVPSSISLRWPGSNRLCSIAGPRRAPRGRARVAFERITGRKIGMNKSEPRILAVRLFEPDDRLVGMPLQQLDDTQPPVPWGNARSVGAEADRLLEIRDRLVHRRRSGTCTSRHAHKPAPGCDRARSPSRIREWLPCSATARAAPDPLRNAPARCSATSPEPAPPAAPRGADRRSGGR